MSIVNGILSRFLLPADADVFFDFLEHLWSALPNVVAGLIYFWCFTVLFFKAFRSLH